MALTSAAARMLPYTAMLPRENKEICRGDVAVSARATDNRCCSTSCRIMASHKLPLLRTRLPSAPAALALR